MRTEIIDITKRDAWEQFIQDNPSSIAWQSYDWSTVLRRHYRFDFYPIAAYDNSKICGVLPIYHLRTARGKEQLISVPYAVAGGIVADHELAGKALLEKAMELSAKHNGCPVTLKQYKVKLDGPLRTDGHFYNKELDLARDPSVIWNGLENRNKLNVEDGDRRNFNLEYPCGDIQGFYKLLLRHHHVRGIPCVGKKWIEDLIAFKMYSIALLRSGSDLVAGTMIKEFKDTVSFPFTCSADGTERTGIPAYSLYWKLIQLFASKGKRIFHSGRIPVTEETDEYRLGWGGTKYNYYYQYYPNVAGTTEFERKRGRKREVFERVWKKIPEGIAGLVGPSIVKQFP